MRLCISKLCKQNLEAIYVSYYTGSSFKILPRKKINYIRLSTFDAAQSGLLKYSKTPLNPINLIQTITMNENSRPEFKKRECW